MLSRYIGACVRVLSRYISAVVVICYMLNVRVLSRYISPVVRVLYVKCACVCVVSLYQPSSACDLLYVKCVVCCLVISAQ